MGMQINTNLAALNAHRNLSNTQNDLSKSLEKLSSGLRINRAADDAAGLSISEGLRSQVNGMSVAARNAQDGISVIQTAEGALTETHSILQRMRDLAVQAGNDSNNAESRQAITNEVNQLVSELGRISDNTNFNGIQLLNGSTGTMNFQIGADGDSNSQIAVNLGRANVSNVADTLSTGTGTTYVVPSAAPATDAAFEVLGSDGLTVLAAASVDLSGVDIVDASAMTDPSEKAATEAANADAMVSALNSDANFAANFVASKNDKNELVVSSTAGIVTDTAGSSLTAGTAGTAGKISFGSAAEAQQAVSLIDSQITTISGARADLGAVQNRFESTINTLNVSRENLQAAESRIRDVDMAAEMVNFTRSNILSQAGTAMLAQANQSNQGVLQLLG